MKEYTKPDLSTCSLSPTERIAYTCTGDDTTNYEIIYATRPGELGTFDRDPSCGTLEVLYDLNAS